MKKFNQAKFMNILSVVLIAILLSFTAVKNIPRLILVIILAIPLIFLAKTLFSMSLFRTLSMEIAFLPVIDPSININSICFRIPDYRDFLQAVITFSELIRILLPVFMILVICAMKKNDCTFGAAIKKYIPHAIIMLIISLIGTFVPEIRELCKLIFTYAAIWVLIDISENKLYKGYNRIFAHLPLFFLYMTSIFNTLILPNSDLSLRSILF